jgi:hypothetical protein
MARAYHGTGEQAIEWALHKNPDTPLEVQGFLLAWQQGNAELEWPDFYEWLDEQEGPHVGDGTGDAAIAIGEHAFRAGFSAATKFDWNFAAEGKEAELENKAWDAYDPPEYIKALS